MRISRKNFVFDHFSFFGLKILTDDGKKFSWFNLICCYKKRSISLAAWPKIAIVMTLFLVKHKIFIAWTWRLSILEIFCSKIKRALKTTTKRLIQLKIRMSFRTKNLSKTRENDILFISRLAKLGESIESIYYFSRFRIIMRARKLSQRVKWNNGASINHSKSGIQVNILAMYFWSPLREYFLLYRREVWLLWRDEFCASSSMFGVDKASSLKPAASRWLTPSDASNQTF